jgi:hypothetical protein
LWCYNRVKEGKGARRMTISVSDMTREERDDRTSAYWRKKLAVVEMEKGFETGYNVHGEMWIALAMKKSDWDQLNEEVEALKEEGEPIRVGPVEQVTKWPDEG